MNTIKYIYGHDNCGSGICDVEYNENFLRRIHSKIPGTILEVTDHMSEYEQSSVNSIILIVRNVIIDSIVKGRVYG